MRRARPAVKARTRASGCTFSTMDSEPRATMRTRMPLPQDAEQDAERAAGRGQQKAFRQQLGRRRIRPAPSARRTAISFCRPAARASRRFAMLAQAISRTRPAMVMRT